MYNTNINSNGVDCKVEILDNPVDFDGDATLILVDSTKWKTDVPLYIGKVLESGTYEGQPIYISISKMDLRDVSETSKEIIDSYVVPEDSTSSKVDDRLKGNVKVIMTSALDKHKDYTKIMFDIIISEAYKKKIILENDELFKVIDDLANANTVISHLRNENENLENAIVNLNDEIATLNDVIRDSPHTDEHERLLSHNEAKHLKKVSGHGRMCSIM